MSNFIPLRIDKFILIQSCSGAEDVLTRWPGQLTTTENVQMQMVHGLTALDTVVHDDSESIGSFLLAQDTANVHQVAHDLERGL